jgi:hypothetical protein
MAGQLKEQFETIGKAAAWATAVLYAIGYFAVQLHFLRYDHHGFAEMVRAQYVAAGIWFFAPLVLGGFFVTALVNWFAATWSVKPKLDLMLKFLLLLVLVLLILGVILIAAFRPNHPWILRQDVAVRFLILSVIGAFVAAPFLLLYSHWASQGEESGDKRTLWQLSRQYFRLSTVLWFLMYVAAFESLLYPYVPQALGGGSLRSVQLAVEPDFKSSAIALGVQFSSEQGYLTGPLSLLTETKDEYVVVIGSPTLPVTISKRRVTLRELPRTQAVGGP